MKKIFSILLLVPALLLTGCKSNEPEKPDSLSDVYLTGFKAYKLPYDGVSYSFGYDGTLRSGITYQPFTYKTALTEDVYHTELPIVYNLNNPKKICTFINLVDYSSFTLKVYYFGTGYKEQRLHYTGTTYINESVFFNNPEKYSYRELVFTSSDGRTQVGVLFDYK